MATANSNSILTIFPYKNNGMWVFDDARVGLDKEALVCGIPEILEKALADASIPLRRAERGCSLAFSANPFPDATVVLSRIEGGDRHNETLAGNWYETQEGLKGWLCPALFCYFTEAPEKLYCKVACATAA
jgi:hypothetical protein